LFQGVSRNRTTRRRFLKLVAGAGLTPCALGPWAVAGTTGAGDSAAIGDGVLRIEFDHTMRSRILRGSPTGAPLTSWSAAETLTLADGARVAHFALAHVRHEPLEGPRGKGVRLTISGSGSAPGQPAARIEMTLRTDLYERYPGVAICQVTWRNVGTATLSLREWRSAAHELQAGAPASAEPAFWSYCGSANDHRFQREHGLGEVC
jgi:alpha-galactosidase